MKKIFASFSDYWNSNKDLILSCTLFLGIFWTLGTTFVSCGFKFLIWFLWCFFIILPFGLLFGLFWALLFIPCMQKVTGEYIIPYMHARIYRFVTHQYEKSIEYYKRAINLLKTSRPNGKKKKIKKSYLHAAYNDLVICYSKLENLEQAEFYIKKAVRYLPNNKKQKYLDKMYKKYIKKSKISLKKWILISAIVVILCILANALNIYNNKALTNNKFSQVAITSDIKKADEIQNLITNMSDMPTLRELDEFDTIISIQSKSKENKNLATVMIADSPFYDSSIHFTNRIYGIGAEKTERKNLEETIMNVPGVLEVFVELSFSEHSMFDCKDEPELPSANVNIITSKDFEQKHIERTVKNILLGTVSGLKEDNIKITFDISENPNQKLIKKHKRNLEWFVQNYYYGARYEYLNNEHLDSNQDYTKSIYYLKLAKERVPHSGFSAKYLIRIQELDKLIKIQSNNYKLYIERGDLRNIPFFANLIEEEQSVTSNFVFAISDYEKALELNPKAYEVYEKLGDAYLRDEYDKYFGGCPNCRVKGAKPEYDKTIDYYNKSVELLGGNDRIYAKLGDVYWLKKDYQKALEYYNQVKAPFNISKTIVPNSCINKYRIHTVLFRKADCYDNLKNRKKALECLELIIQKSDNEKEIWSAKNYRFNLYVKSFNILEAIRHVKEIKCF